MPAYVIVDVRIDDPITYEEYKRLTPESIAAFGGRFVVRGGEVQILEGDWAPGRIVVLEFESADRAREWWDSSEYRPARDLRQRSARTRMILVEGISPSSRPA